MAILVPFRALLAGSLLAASSLSAFADSTIDVEINQAKILKLSRPADTVVIGNPLIADASVQDASTIVLTGKGFGQTNLVVLAEDGTPIVDQQISVSRNSASTVRIYRRAEIQTLFCAPYCESPFKTESEKKSDAEMDQSQ
jgi:Flp pilus assembly secretin CpaC